MTVVAGLPGWVREQWRVYLDNAAMTKEYRTQLRSNKAPWFLSGYLMLLIVTASLFYIGIQTSGVRSVAEIQDSLRTFFGVVVGMMEFMVALSAPVIAASGIVSEYTTRMIDLVFSSPMSPKYFLVGKLVASYRYVLILLVVSLPIAAVSVVLGGATWADVVAAYALVSFHGLLYMAISVPIAVMTGKAVSTVVWSYLAAFLFSVALSAFTLVGAARPGGSLPLLAGMTPFATSFVASGTTELLGTKVPVWIPAGVFTLLVAKIMLLSAGSVLTGAGSKETFSLRIHGLVLCLTVPFLMAYGTGGSRTIALPGSGGAVPTAVWPLMWCFVVFLPFVSVWSSAGGAKTWPNGLFSVKWILRGTPSSGLPYLLLLTLSMVVGQVLGTLATGQQVGPENAAGIVGLFAASTMAWSFGWLSSALMWRQGPEAARRLTLLFLFMVTVAPIVVLGILESASAIGTWGLPQGWTETYNMTTFAFDAPPAAAAKAAVMGLIALAAGGFGEWKRRKILSEMEPYARTA
ncbi:MAG: hypothetical protein JST30_03180 [Armatimonadetes bacterium]|nr:hypothetical protein [Armatimonadota bacterium]